ncbi:hypothetical protein NRIC_33080 [Enterococcus florum]|uniref:Uncharacterized protein n=1 Tax=Enterococcus florum TaxID=2480627 RepID=A0A4P5PB93_9ENTE|nr:hypothetical protein NRIC_33080 [Enterococcus florum]
MASIRKSINSIPPHTQPIDFLRKRQIEEIEKSNYQSKITSVRIDISSKKSISRNIMRKIAYVIFY